MLSSSSSLPTGSSPPESFFKFRSMSLESRPFLESLIIRNEVYLAPAATFNDPFDLRPAYSLDGSAAAQREDFLRMSRKFEPHLSEEARALEADTVMSTSLSAEGRDTTRMLMQFMLNEYIRAQVGIYCVAEDWSNILMWSHYADQH